VTHLEGREATEANRLFWIFANRVVRSLRVEVHWKGEAVSPYRRSKASSRWELIEGFEVVGREYPPLNNGEVNLNLIEPASVDGGVHEDHVRPLRAQAVDRLLAAMGGTLVPDPENATCRLVGFSAHDFSNQAIDRSNPVFFSQRPNTSARCTSPAARWVHALTEVFVFPL
jgi:hypothetical protein